MNNIKRIGMAAATVLVASLWQAGQITALASGPGPLVPTTSMGTARSGHTATLLSDGTVMVTGGQTCVLMADGGGCDMSGTATTATAEIYNPVTASWSGTGNMVVSRTNAVAIRLANGKVLVAGGSSQPDPLLAPVDVASAEIFDPATGTWSLTGQLNSAADYGMLTLLTDGTVLDIGSSTSAYLYHPDTGTWAATGSMATGHLGGTATRLPDARVLVAGGFTTTAQTSIASPEIYNPASGTWSPGGAMVWPRTGHSAALLSDGTVLVAGGSEPIGGVNTALTSAEIFQPSTGLWSATGATASTHFGVPAILLSDGTVLLVDTASEVYDPVARSWASTTGMTANYGETATGLWNGSVLVAGGCCDAVTWTYMSHAELYSAPGTTIDSPLTGTGRSFNSMEGNAFYDSVASFTDADPNGTASQFSAIIDWNDGTSSPGTVQAGTSGFHVFGSHTYLEEGYFNVAVSIMDTGGAATLVKSTIGVVDNSVAVGGASTVLTARERVATSLTLGTLKDSDPNGTAADYAVSVAWGDGITSAGSIAASGSSYSISGSHTYQKRGQYTITVSGRDVGGASGTAQDSISVTR